MKTSGNHKIKLPPITDQDGNMMSDTELAQWTTKSGDDFSKWRAKSGELLFSGIKLSTQIAQMRRAGQMSSQEWHSPALGFAGFTAILCELNPDYEVKKAITLGDFQEAAIAAVIDATNARQHPQYEKLRQIYNAFQNQSEEEKDIYELWYQWDLALQATSKYRPSDLDKMEFHESRPNYTLREFVEWLEKKSAKPKAKIIERAPEFPFHTSQEMDIRQRAQCDGKALNGWFTNSQSGAIVYERKGAPHLVSLALTEDERAAGMNLNYLENLIRSQDADAVLATEYILGVLAPPPHLPARYAGGWIDFDDVIKKIGWNPQTTKARHEMHAQIWGFVKFGERAHIIGKRTGAKYKDGDGNEIDTTIHGAAWRVMKTETPDQPSLYAAFETPVRAEIVISKELTALLTNAYTAQYLQGAEILGAIPGGQASGAWARVLGMALSSFWRRKPREHGAGTLKPTRRELLDHYAAKVAPYEEVLESKNPARLLEYWCGALQMLADGGFIERSGEAAISDKEMRAGMPRKNWQDTWLNETVNITPGAKMLDSVQDRAKSLPALKPRDLKKKPRARSKRRKV